MKKAIFALTILAVLSFMVACNQATATQNKSGTGGNTAPLSTATQLLVGTFKLENTDLAVSASQARQLLPLWQTLQAISTSNTAATEEINAVVDQIKSGMTAQQMAKITAMKLTQQDVMSVMNQAGVSLNGGNATTTPLAANSFPGFPGNGGGGGGAPGGGGGIPGGGGGAPGGGGGIPGGGGGFGTGGVPANGTPQAIQANPNQVPAPLLNALIELLQKKIK